MAPDVADIREDLEGHLRCREIPHWLICWLTRRDRGRAAHSRSWHRAQGTDRPDSSDPGI